MVGVRERLGELGGVGATRSCSSAAPGRGPVNFDPSAQSPTRRGPRTVINYLDDAGRATEFPHGGLPRLQTVEATPEEVGPERCSASTRRSTTEARSGGRRSGSGRAGSFAAMKRGRPQLLADVVYGAKATSGRGNRRGTRGLGPGSARTEEEEERIARSETVSFPGHVSSSSSTAAGSSATRSGPPSSYLAGHVPGAAFLDVDRDLSAPPGPGGRHPLPAAESSPPPRAAPGSARASSSSRTGPWAAPSGSGGCCATSATTTAPSRPDRRLARPAARRRGGRSSRPPSSRGGATATRSGATSWPPGTASSSWSTRASPTAGAASRTRSTTRPAGSRARATRRGTSRCRSCPAGELVVYCGSGVTACVRSTGLARGPRRAALSRLVERVGAARPAGRTWLSRD